MIASRRKIVTEQPVLNEERATPPAVRRPYEPPILTKFGGLAELTRSNMDGLTADAGAYS